MKVNGYSVDENSSVNSPDLDSVASILAIGILRLKIKLLGQNTASKSTPETSLINLLNPQD